MDIWLLILGMLAITFAKCKIGRASCRERV